jgi:hypothetical protein
MSNLFPKITDLGIAINEWRIFPRIFIIAYITLFFNATEWFMALEDPSTQQTSFVSTVVGAGSIWFGLYINSGRK